jgi:phosphoribosylformimino-5-aminoimidazole carboxamide ribotide isomerase
MLQREDSDFDVVPAVDVLSGRVVRLAQGRPEHVTAEGGDPVALARRWADEGAGRIHLVNLDGAFSGDSDPTLIASVAALGIGLQVGGGLRSLSAIEHALDAGADRVIVGTAALDDRWLGKALSRFAEALIVAVDVRGGRVAFDGWRRVAKADPVAFARRCADAGVHRLLVTATARDGSLEGPDLGLLAPVIDVGVPVLAAGGVGTIADVHALRDIGCEGAVVGSALLRGRFRLREALASLSRG